MTASVLKRDPNTYKFLKKLKKKKGGGGGGRVPKIAIYYHKSYKPILV